MHTALLHLNQNSKEDIIWDFNEVDSMLPRQIHQITEELNNTGFHSLINPLRSLARRDEESGVDFALLENYGDSKNYAVIHFNPFANGLSDNMLLRAAYLKKIFDNFEIRDSDENLLPLLTFSAPTGNNKLKVEPHHHKKIAAGNFEDLASHYLQIIKKLGYRESAIIGFSQGASTATAAAALSASFDIKVTHLAVGEPANIMHRPKRLLVRQFGGSFKQLKPAVEATGLQPLKDAHARESSIKYMFGIARQSKLNLNLLRGLSKESFLADLQKTMQQNCLTTIGYGGLTSISPPKQMQELINGYRKKESYLPHSLHSVEVKGAHHAWADQLNLLAMFYSYALTR